MLIEKKKVCVFVLYNCIFPLGAEHRPNLESGMRRIDINDPRAVCGSSWGKICPYVESGKCKNGACDSSGRVIAIIESCDECAQKEFCIWYCKEELYC